MIRQVQDIAGFIGLVSDGADRACPKTSGLGGQNKGRESNRRIDAGIEKGVEMVIGRRRDPLAHATRAAGDYWRKRRREPANL